MFETMEEIREYSFIREGTINCMKDCSEEKLGVHICKNPRPNSRGWPSIHQPRHLYFFAFGVHMCSFCHKWPCPSTINHFNVMRSFVPTLQGKSRADLSCNQCK